MRRSEPARGANPAAPAVPSAAAPAVPSAATHRRMPEAGVEPALRAARVEDFGLAAPVLPGWAVAIRRRDPEGLRVAAVDRTGVLTATGEVLRPVLHASTAALPADRGDFGTGAVQLLGSADVFLALVEYAPEDAGRGLFARAGMPRLAPSQFDPGNLQRPVAHVSAAQHFFSVGGRAFCLFAVVGAHRRRMATVPRLAAMAAGVRITPYDRMPR